LVLLIAVASLARGNDNVVHWINSASQSALTVLNSGGTFTTDFKGSGDVAIKLVSGTLNSLYGENFAASPGNNPSWVTGFIGSSAQGTGSGAPGHWTVLETTSPSTNLSSVQFDFSRPLLPGDRILLLDCDSNEQYHIEAFLKSGGDYNVESLAGWTFESYTGQTGITPNNQWPTWQSGGGLLTASTSGNLNEPLDVLVPDARVDRIIFSKLSGGGSGEIQFAANAGLAGDYNRNGIVDAADYTVWRDTLGQPASAYSGADGNGNATIDAGDYTVWSGNFGDAIGGGGAGANSSSPAAVPEPSSRELFVWCAALLAHRFSGRWRRA
jgi:hypothetical protein